MNFWDKLDDPELAKQRVQKAKALFERLGRCSLSGRCFFFVLGEVFFFFVFKIRVVFAFSPCLVYVVAFFVQLLGWFIV